MIKNDKQHKVSIKSLQDFSVSLSSILESDKPDLVKEIMRNAINSEIEILRKDIQEYEKLRFDKPTVLTTDIEHIPETLIKARIARGLSQSELAKRTGLKEQQIQRYESSNYEGANLERLIHISQALDGVFQTTRFVLKQEELLVDGIDPLFIRQATAKLQKRKFLFPV